MPQPDHKKRDYTLISAQTKKQLIQLVEGQNYPIKVAAELLKLKLSTAKLIVKKYRVSQKQNQKKWKNQPLKRKPIKPQETEQNQVFKESDNNKSSASIQNNSRQNQINLQPCIEGMQQLINWLWLSHYYSNMAIYSL